MLPILLTHVLTGVGVPLFLSRVAPRLNVVPIHPSRQALAASLAGNLLAHPVETTRNLTSGAASVVRAITGKGLVSHPLSHTLSDSIESITGQVTANLSNNQESIKASLEMLTNQVNALTENHKHRSKELLLTSIILTTGTIWGVSYLKGRFLPQQPCIINPIQDATGNLEAYRIFQEQINTKHDLFLEKLKPLAQDKAKEKAFLITSSQVYLYIGLGAAIGIVITFSFIAYQRSASRSKFDRRD